jgi:cytochrome c biogenesis protein CcdA
MPSRISLSILAFICGLAVMFVGGAYGVVTIPTAAADATTLIIVIVGLLAMAVGWIRIFARRPNRVGESDTNAG